MLYYISLIQYEECVQTQLQMKHYDLYVDEEVDEMIVMDGRLRKNGTRKILAFYARASSSCSSLHMITIAFMVSRI